MFTQHSTSTQTFTCSRVFNIVVFLLLPNDFSACRSTRLKGSESIFHQSEIKAALAPVPPSAALQLQYLTGMTEPLSLLWCNETSAIRVNPSVVPLVYWFARCLWAAQTSRCAQHHEEEQIQLRQDAVCRKKINKQSLPCLLSQISCSWV